MDDTKCKTVFKNSFTTQMETQVGWEGFALQKIVKTFDTIVTHFDKIFNTIFIKIFYTIFTQL